MWQDPPVDSYARRESFRHCRMRGPAAAIAVPAAVGLITAYMAKKSADKQAETLRRGLTPTTSEAAAARGALSGGEGLLAAAPGLLSIGQQSTGPAAGYYGALLGRGGRTAMQAAVAPAASNVRETYEGLKRSIQPGDRSGTAALQRSEADRESAGQISRLTAGVQPMAANALAGIGSTATGQGLGALGTGGSVLGNLTTGLAQARLGAAGQARGIGQDQSSANQQTGSSLMGILGKAGKGGGGGGGGKGAALGGGGGGGIPGGGIAGGSGIPA